ncbi:hypothetical protein [Caproicibacter sp. BJN0012]|uniref:hypothetical protein n=1 Tax=Caproicibacter sp. BJN0012 TaxID=3110227 RepID=UPI002E1246C9
MEINNQRRDDFSEHILADLVPQGFSEEELLEKFKKQSKKVRPVVKKLNAEADSLTENDLASGAQPRNRRCQQPASQQCDVFGKLRSCWQFLHL